MMACISKHEKGLMLDVQKPWRWSCSTTGSCEQWRTQRPATLGVCPGSCVGVFFYSLKGNTAWPNALANLRTRLVGTIGLDMVNKEIVARVGTQSRDMHRL